MSSPVNSLRPPITRLFFLLTSASHAQGSRTPGVAVRGSGRWAGACHLESQDLRHLDGAVLDVQRAVGVEVEPLVVDPRQDLGDAASVCAGWGSTITRAAPSLIGIVSHSAVWEAAHCRPLHKASRSLGAVAGGWTMGPRLTLLDGVWAPAVQPITRQRRATDVTVGAGLAPRRGPVL